MTLLTIAVGGAEVAIEVADTEATQLVTAWFPTAAEHPTTAADLIAHVAVDGDVATVDLTPVGGAERSLPSAEAIIELSGVVAEQLAMRVTEGAALHAAAVQRGNDVVVLPGASGAGKSTAAIRLAIAGWTLLTDELAHVDDDGSISGLLRPVGMKRPIDPGVLDELTTSEVDPYAIATRYVGLVDATAIGEPAEPQPAAAAVLVFPAYDPELPPGVRRLSPIESAERLLAHQWGATGREDVAFHRLAELARQATAVEVTGRRLDDMVDIVDALVSGTDPAELLAPIGAVEEPTRTPRPTLSDLDPLSIAAISHCAGEWLIERFTPEYHRRLAARRHSMRRALVIDERTTDEPEPLHRTLRMWREYLPHAEIIGATDTPTGYELGDRIELRRITGGNQWTSITAASGPFDLVVQTHASDLESVRRWFDDYFPQLADGGVYAVEQPAGTTLAAEFASELTLDLHLPERRAVDEMAPGNVHAGSIAAVDATRNLCMVVRGANRRRSALVGRLDELHIRNTIELLEQARQILPNGRAEAALAHVYERFGETNRASEWAQRAVTAGSTERWVTELATRTGR